MHLKVAAASCRGRAPAGPNAAALQSAGDWVFGDPLTCMVSLYRPQRPCHRAGTLSRVPGPKALATGPASEDTARGPERVSDRGRSPTYRVPQERAHVTWWEPIHQLRPLQQRRVRPRPALGLDQAHVPVLGRQGGHAYRGQGFGASALLAMGSYPCPDQRAVATDCGRGSVTRTPGWLCRRLPTTEAAPKACSEPASLSRHLPSPSPGEQPLSFQLGDSTEGCRPRASASPSGLVPVISHWGGSSAPPTPPGQLSRHARPSHLSTAVAALRCPGCWVLKCSSPLN